MAGRPKMTLLGPYESFVPEVVEVASVHMFAVPLLMVVHLAHRENLSRSLEAYLFWPEIFVWLDEGAYMG